MPASIDYMNARANAKPAAGGKSYARLANPVDERSKLVGMSDDDVMETRLVIFWQEHFQFVREMRNSLAAGLTVDEAAIPF